MKANIVIVLLFILSINIFSQPARNNINTEAFYINIIALPTDNKDSIDVFVYYTFCYNELVFQKTNDNDFFSVPDLEVTFKDNDGITRKRFISDDTIFANNYDQIQEKIYYSNSTQFRLANNDYKIVSKTNNSKYRSNPIEYTISNYYNENKIKNIFILDNEHKPFYSNNCVPYDAYSFFVFIPINYINSINPSNTKYTYTIEKIENKKNELSWKHFNKIENKIDVIENVLFEVKDNKLKISTIENKPIISFLATEINIWHYNFTPGKYILTMANGDTKTEFNFEIKWYNMPQSLLDPVFAVEQMYLILTNDEYKQIKNGNKNEIFANILNYWKHHDPTPATEYNEAMAEFFNRVDYAEINFRTITQRNGAKSDKGKIYILNGKPDEIYTNTKDKKTTEIWFYKKLNKKYIFEVVSVGNYKLVEIDG